ncbi:MAG TPA: hypothetical protein VMG30_03950 [Acidobacteriota bacterium]|nr:hypothetical protein [Acidobacteriota bacterium]
MERTLRFAAAFVTWIASLIVHRTTSNWFGKDVRLRSLLATSGSPQDSQ